MMERKWEIIELGKLVKILDKFRRPVTKKDRAKGSYPYYGATGIQDYVDSYIFDGRYLLVGEDGAKWMSGDKSAFIIEGKSWVNNHAHVLKVGNSLIDKYLEFFLIHKDLSEYITGAIIPKLTQQSLKSIPIPVPPLPVQARIVDELDCLQGILSKKRQQLAEYHSLAQAIFHQMFGDPVVNEKGWEVKRLGEITNNLDSKRKPITKKDRKEGIYPYYGASGITDYVEGFIFDGNYLLVSEDGANLLTRTAPIAFLALGKIWINNHVHVMQCDNIASHTYIQYHLNQITLKKYISGSAQPKLNQEKLNSIPIPFPPLPLQQSFANRIAVINNQCESLNKSIHEMETLLATRMDKLLNMNC